MSFQYPNRNDYLITLSQDIMRIYLRNSLEYNDGLTIPLKYTLSDKDFKFIRKINQKDGNFLKKKENIELFYEIVQGIYDKFNYPKLRALSSTHSFHNDNSKKPKSIIQKVIENKIKKKFSFTYLSKDYPFLQPYIRLFYNESINLLDKALDRTSQYLISYTQKEVRKNIGHFFLSQELYNTFGHKFDDFSSNSAISVPMFNNKDLALEVSSFERREHTIQSIEKVIVQTMKNIIRDEFNLNYIHSSYQNHVEAFEDHINSRAGDVKKELISLTDKRIEEIPITINELKSSKKVRKPDLKKESYNVIKNTLNDLVHIYDFTDISDLNSFIKSKMEHYIGSGLYIYNPSNWEDNFDSYIESVKNLFLIYNNHKLTDLNKGESQLRNIIENCLFTKRYEFIKENSLNNWERRFSLFGRKLKKDIITYQEKNRAFENSFKELYYELVNNSVPIFSFNSSLYLSLFWNALPSSDRKAFLSLISLDTYIYKKIDPREFPKELKEKVKKKGANLGVPKDSIIKNLDLENNKPIYDGLGVVPEDWKEFVELSRSLLIEEFASREYEDLNFSGCYYIKKEMDKRIRHLNELIEPLFIRKKGNKIRISRPAYYIWYRNLMLAEIYRKESGFSAFNSNGFIKEGFRDWRDIHYGLFPFTDTHLDEMKNVVFPKKYRQIIPLEMFTLDSIQDYFIKLKDIFEDQTVLKEINDQFDKKVLEMEEKKTNLFNNIEFGINQIHSINLLKHISHYDINNLNRTQLIQKTKKRVNELKDIKREILHLEHKDNVEFSKEIESLKKKATQMEQNLKSLLSYANLSFSPLNQHLSPLIKSYSGFSKDIRVSLDSKENKILLYAKSDNGEIGGHTKIKSKNPDKIYLDNAFNVQAKEFYELLDTNLEEISSSIRDCFILFSNGKVSILGNPSKNFPPFHFLLHHNESSPSLEYEDIKDNSKESKIAFNVELTPYHFKHLYKDFTDSKRGVLVKCRKETPTVTSILTRSDGIRFTIFDRKKFPSFIESFSSFSFRQIKKGFKKGFEKRGYTSIFIPKKKIGGNLKEGLYYLNTATLKETCGGKNNWVDSATQESAEEKIKSEIKQSKKGSSISKTPLMKKCESQNAIKNAIYNGRITTQYKDWIRSNADTSLDIMSIRIGVSENMLKIRMMTEDNKRYSLQSHLLLPFLETDTYRNRSETHLEYIRSNIKSSLDMFSNLKKKAKNSKFITYILSKVDNDLFKKIIDILKDTKKLLSSNSNETILTQLSHPKLFYIVLEISFGETIKNKEFIYQNLDILKDNLSSSSNISFDKPHIFLGESIIGSESDFQGFKSSLRNNIGFIKYESDIDTDKELFTLFFYFFSIDYIIKEKGRKYLLNQYSNNTKGKKVFELYENLKALSRAYESKSKVSYTDNKELYLEKNDKVSELKEKTYNNNLSFMEEQIDKIISIYRTIKKKGKNK